MEREKHQFSDMDGGLGTSRRLAALHATGEEGETVKDISVTYDATNSNRMGGLWLMKRESVAGSTYVTKQE